MQQLHEARPPRMRPDVRPQNPAQLRLMLERRLALADPLEYAVAPLPGRDEAHVLIDEVEREVHLAAADFLVRGEGVQRQGGDQILILDQVVHHIDDAIEAPHFRSAKVDASKGVLILELAAGNRVRVEQIRDLIQQDGTKAVRVPRIVVGGVVEKGSDSEWMLRLPQQALPLELKTSKALTAGATIKVEGAIEDLKKSPLVLVETSQ